MGSCCFSLGVWLIGIWLFTVGPRCSTHFGALVCLFRAFPKRLLRTVLWMRLLNLPQVCWLPSNLELIASAAGRFIKMDDSTLQSKGRFAKVVVEVDPSLQLVPERGHPGRWSWMMKKELKQLPNTQEKLEETICKIRHVPRS